MNTRSLLLFYFAFLLFFVPLSEAQTLVRISGMGDFSLGNWVGGSFSPVENSLCIYKSEGTTSYRITPSGSGSGGAFTLSRGAATLAYRMSFRGSTGSAFEFTAPPNQSNTFSHANQTSTNCGGVDNAYVKIWFNESALLAAPAGSYSGTLTLLLEPS